MRIGIDAHTLGQNKTGNETYARGLIGQFLQEQDPSLDFVFYHTEPLSGYLDRKPFKRIYPGNPLIRVPFAFPLAFHRDRIDLAHFQYFAPLYCPCPFVLSVHDVSYAVYPEFFSFAERKRLEWMVPRAMEKASYVLTGSLFSKQEILRVYSLSEEKVVVIPYGIDPVFLNPELPPKALTEKWNLTRPYLLSVGTFHPRKNLKRLIQVFHHLRTRGKIELDLVLVGPPHPASEELPKEWLELREQGFLHFTGFVTEEELRALYHRALFFVYLSLYEGFGFPVLEAMACGTPVLASRSSSIPEIAGDAAFLVNPEDVSEMEQAFLRLSEDRVLRQELRKKGTQQVRNFSWQECAAKTADVYRRCAS